MKKSDKVFSWDDAHNYLPMPGYRNLAFGMIEHRTLYHFICDNSNKPLKKDKRTIEIAQAITNTKYLEVFW